jgi:ATP-dependent helicase/nuclease subunit A
MSAPHSLLLASAGTGKTYRLATHFAALLALGVEPNRVLATTFTRKAAGEILDRVLARLVEAASTDENGSRARNALDGAARRVLGAPHHVTREVALERLATLARQIGRFQVRTLDSFFVQVARLFAYELALMPEWHIADDVEDEELRAEILARVIADLGPDERLALLQAIAQAGAPTASHSSLSRTIDTALQLHREATPGAWDVIDAELGPSDDALRAASDVVRTFDLPRKKTGKRGEDGRGEPYAAWVKFQQDATRALDTRDWRAWLGLTLTKNVRAGQSALGGVEVSIELAEAVRVIDLVAVADMTRELAAANRATGHLCDHYVARERAVKDRTGAYRFDDFPRALAAGPAGAVDDEDRALWLADLGYRLDTRIAHLLLDEFQDTAPLQWRLLLPLAQELLAGGDDQGVPRTFFCVGDVKQSIYGWREAEPRILGEMEARHPELVAEPMTESWRSSNVVLDTVNRIFSGLAESAVFAGEERDTLRARAAEWAAGFRPHRRAAGAGPCAGAALLLEAPAPPDSTNAAAKAAVCIELAAERVQALTLRQPRATVAILVRAKSVIPRLLYLLRQLGIDASGEGGNPLTDAPLVAQALALLHLADHPDDGVAALSVVHSPFAKRYALDGVRPDDPASRAKLRAAAARVRRELVDAGYGAFFERLARDTAAGASDWDRARFGQLVELALVYDTRASLRPTTFAALVRRERVESPTGARVRVMTVHASKGLEFDAVILPQLAGSLTGQLARLLSYKAGPLEPTTLLTRAPVKAILDLREDLRGLSDDGKARALVDELSVLYVAATRAIHHLELIVPEQAAEPPKEARLRPTELVREALTGAHWSPPAKQGVVGDEGLSATVSEQPPSDVRELWRHPDSDLDWCPEPARSASKAPRAAPSARPLALAPSLVPRLKPYRTPSGTEARRPDIVSLLAPPDRRARELGTLVHELFEGVEWLEDDTRSDAALRAALQRHSSEPAQIDAALQRYRAALQHSAVRAALSRMSLGTLVADETLEVLRERSFDVELTEGDVGDCEAWRGSIDRLVVVRRGAVVVRAEVLDFKTDAVEGAGIAARVDVYRPQLDAYRRIVAALYELPPEDVRAGLLFVTAGVRVDV